MKIDLSRYKCLLLDFDGTLVDSEPLHYGSFHKVLSDIGIEYGSFEYHCFTYLGSGAKHILETELEKHGKTGQVDVEELISQKKALYRATLDAEGMKLIPGALEFLQKAHEKGIPMVLVSGGICESILYVLDKAGLTNDFVQILTIEN
jgi:beta-phosphoglucomutase-like phosphatase (HAD superfamily)